MKPLSIASSLVLLCGAFAGAASASTAEELARQKASEFAQATPAPLSKSSESQDAAKAKSVLGAFVKRAGPPAKEGQ